MKATKGNWLYDLVDETGFTKKDCSVFADGFSRVVQNYLLNGDDFYLAGVGTLSLKEKAATKVPSEKGSSVMKECPPHTFIRFTPSKKLKEAVFNVKPNNDDV